MAQPAIGAQASRLARNLTLIGSSATSTPKLVYGTAWKKEKTSDLVYTALKTGFRGLDTAAQPKHYDEPGVGAGVKRAVSEGLIKRKDLYIQTKFTSPNGQSNITPYDLHAPLAQQVNQSIQSSLRNFTLTGQEPYLDSVVLHSPMDTIEETFTVWRTLETYHPTQIRNLGISNTTLDVLQALYSQMSVRPALVQNRFYGSTNYEVDLRAFCREKDIVFQCFWTLGANKALVKSQPVTRIMEMTGVSGPAAYYCLVLGLEGVSIMDGTTSEEHMKEDLEEVEQVGFWAENDGVSEWASVLTEFKSLIGEA